MPSKPVEYAVWKHGDRSFSVFSAYVPEGAELVIKGWTVAHGDGTRGLARPPFVTREDAQAWCDANPHFSGMSQG